MQARLSLSDPVIQRHILIIIITMASHFMELRLLISIPIPVTILDIIGVVIMEEAIFIDPTETVDSIKGIVAEDFMVVVGEDMEGGVKKFLD